MNTIFEKTFFLSRHGCAKNQVDAELLVGWLNALGWKPIDEAENAAVILVNTCGFIESAKKESLEAVFQARAANPGAIIIVAGCLAERYANELAQDLPEADYFFGNGDISKITELFKTISDTDGQKNAKNAANKKRVWLYPQKGVCCGARPLSFSFPASTYIKITEGCNNCCSFCAIPLIRGSVRSRSIADIVGEIKMRAQAGVYEFNLIGQDLASFTCETEELHHDSALAELLCEIGKLKEDFLIRLLYIHPDNFPLDILPIMQADRRFLPYFDLPFQSASEKVLKAMNRRGNAQKYLALIENIQSAFRESPYRQACIRTTFLTGFPGETDADFNETLQFLKDAKALWSGAFDFSPEENTKAVSLAGQIPQKIALERKQILEACQSEITAQVLEKFIGQTLPVLVEEIIENPNEQNYFVLGRSWFQAPEVDGSVVTVVDSPAEIKRIKPGSKITVKITAVRTVDLEAELLSEQHG